MLERPTRLREVEVLAAQSLTPRRQNQFKKIHAKNSRKNLAPPKSDS